MSDLSFFWFVLAVVALLLVLRWRRFGAGRFGSGRFGSGRFGFGVDVEGDLLRACRGDRSMAERLIRYEIDRKPELSRTGAALMALSRLRDDAR